MSVPSVINVCPVCKRRPAGAPAGVCPFCILDHRYIAPRPDVPAAREAPATLPRLGELEADLPRVPRRAIGWPVLDTVLGGGVAPGQVLLLSGDPGAGKTQLVLRLADALEPSLFVSAEMSLPMLAEYVARTGAGRRAHVLEGGAAETIVLRMREIRPALVIVDSLHAAADADGESGGVAQLAERLATAARALGSVLLLIAHVTKDGTRAGPESIAHLVDTDVALHFADATDAPEARVLSVGKNRLGPSGMRARLTLTAEGYLP